MKKGDSLWSIAKKLLGDGAKFKEIQAANGLDDTVIHPGMVLKIPHSKPSNDEIKRAFEEASNDVENLPSVKKFYQLIGV